MFAGGASGLVGEKGACIIFLNYLDYLLLFSIFFQDLVVSFFFSYFISLVCECILFLYFCCFPFFLCFFFLLI